MNLDRISIKMGGANTSYMSLAKISDFSKLYTTILFIEKSSPQKINTGDSIQAFNFKNIEQFKGLRPFNAYTQEQLLFLYNQYGSDFLYQTKLHSGDLVRYNGLKYVVLGIVVNTYAQWNMPTPLLFNPTNVNNDYKSLYGSRLTEEQINSKINDNFQAGKYDADMIIPLVDANDFSEYITVIEPRPTKEEVELMFDSVKAEKDLTIKSQKDVFIDTMLRLRGNEINKIKEVNEDLFKGVQTLLLSVNKAVNEQIELLPEPAVEKPERKPRAKKVVEEVEPVVELAEKQTIISIYYFDDKFASTSDLYEFLKELFKEKQLLGSFDFPIKIQYLDKVRLTKNKSIEVKATNISPVGNEFNFETMSSKNFLEYFMKFHPEYDWAKFDGYGEVVDKDLPDFIGKDLKVKDYPEQVKKLIEFRSSQQEGFAYILDDTIVFAFDWDKTQEGIRFWSDINSKGDLRDFKKLYGNKGEKVDELIAKEELPKAPAVITQEVKRVDIILYPPEGGVLEIKTDSLYELFEVNRFILSKYKSSAIKFNFNLITDYGSHTTELYFSGEDSQDELLSSLVERYDRFGYFDWKNFDERQADIDKIKLNEEIINDAYPEQEPKPVKVEKPKPVPIEKPKPVKVEKPKPVPVEKPKPVKVEKSKPVPVEKPKPVPIEKPKPVKVEKPKPVKVEKPKPVKVTKPKVEDDLSFLDDLDNIF